MTINTQMSQQEINQVNYKVDAFNTKLKEDQKIVSKNSLGEADFMQLLITQLKTQDPTKPLEDKEFIAQMAQFTSLKQMNNLTDNMKNFTKDFAFTKAVALVNKTVSYVDSNSGQIAFGNVDSVKVKNGETFLNIGGQEVELGQISEVKNIEQKQTAAAETEAPKQAERASRLADFGDRLISRM